MDLPTCPHCGQSVLDEDVDECPFCGESMSAKPSGKKAAAPKAAPAPVSQETAPAKSETKSPARRPEKTRSRSDEPAPIVDQPFAVDQSALSNAIPLRPKPSPGRAFKVVCPMCETVGYTSPKAGGREVKCANPKCLVPLFTCPEPPPAPVQEAPPEPEGLSTAVLGLISLVAIAAVGFGVWYFILRGDDSPSVDPADPGNGLAAEPHDGTEKTPSAENGDGPEPAQPPVRRGPDLTKLREQAARNMVAVSELPSGRSSYRPKPLRVEWTALAFAELGKLQEAEQQLARLSTFTDDEPHYRVLPWVEIGWRLREREESPANAVGKALEFSKKPPPSLHESWLEAVSLSALLAATGRTEDTAGVLNRNLGRPADQELWQDLMAVQLDRSFNLEALERVRPVVTPNNPAWSGVVWQLIFHDAPAEALEWAKRANDPQTRAEALIAWADARIAQGLAENQPTEPEGLDAAIQELPAPWPAVAEARAYARMGQRHLIAGDSTRAESLLNSAQQALSRLPQPEPMAVPDLTAIYNGNFPRRQSNQHVAVAAFEVARLQSSLNHKEQAWKSIEHGLAALRSESLPKNAAEQLLAEIKAGADFIRNDLKTALSLNSDDQARQAYLTYLKHVNELNAQAKARLQLQADLLGQAAHWNLAEQVHNEITSQSSAEGGDSYLATDLPWVVLAELRTQNADLANSLEASLKQNRSSKPKGQALLENSAGWMKDLNIPKVVDGLVRDKTSLPDPVRRRWILRLASQEVLKGRVDDMLSFLTGLFNADPFLGEDAAELLTGLATRQGHGETIWNELNQRDWAPTQKLAAYRGFLAAVPPAKKEPESN